MGAWEYPEEIRKDIDLSELNDLSLYSYHDNLHIFWNKLSEGFKLVDPEIWTFSEIYNFHKNILSEFEKRNLIHISPINNLDLIEDNEDKEEIEQEEKSEEDDIEYGIMIGE